ncbi:MULTISPECIES: GNAT family N-acetyltransferase [Streptomyces]|uniref:GNAT family N-acetyltransferase n=1 Tax=Streptomyces solicathayae TaxID=3081768 RepID=A0ABZ0M2E2_9ACTN|nr:GNAT family N-acetyltransferase [Streptomyces sp. HUAS YS2]WOX25800.1 GNAT family N-acetyltransferase [Streptomyces sp. HUAS YS2]
MQIETSRLRLRRFHPRDVPDFAAYRSDREVARYQNWDFPLPLASARRLVDEYARRDPTRPGWFPYAIELKEDERLVGDIAVNRHPGGAKAELGFSIARARQGQGYASEAVRGVLAELFAQGLRTAVAECDVRNTPSARLLERLGFTFAREHSFFEREKRAHITLSEFTLPAERWATLGRQ